MRNEPRQTDGRELLIYVGLHLLGLLVAFTVFPSIFASLAKSGYADQVYTVSVMLHVGLIGTVVALFLIIRRRLRATMQK